MERRRLVDLRFSATTRCDYTNYNVSNRRYMVNATYQRPTSESSSLLRYLQNKTFVRPTSLLAGGVSQTQIAAIALNYEFVIVKSGILTHGLFCSFGFAAQPCLLPAICGRCCYVCSASVLHTPVLRENIRSLRR